MSERDPQSPIEKTGEEASQGHTVLRHRWSRTLFIGGLAALVLFMLFAVISGLA